MDLPLTQHDRTAGPGDDRPGDDEQGRFYYSFSAPDAYLAAERVLQIVPFVAPWTPIRPPLDAWAFRCVTEQEIEQDRIMRLAAERGLQPVRWPPRFDDELALRAATFAKSIGRIVAFTLATFRQAYAGGADLSQESTILIAAAACEIHPRALLAAIKRPAIERALSEATAEAASRGVRDVPAIVLPDGTVLHGDAALDEVGA